LSRKYENFQEKKGEKVPLVWEPSEKSKRQISLREVHDSTERRHLLFFQPRSSGFKMKGLLRNFIGRAKCPALSPEANPPQSAAFSTNPKS